VTTRYLLDVLPHGFWVALAISLGLVFGSFLNVVIYRLPRGLNVAFPGSACPACQRPIRAWDNIPIVSWVALRGRARCCGTSIPTRYPLVELLGAGLSWAVLELVLQDNAAASAAAIMGLYFSYLALCLGLLAAIFIDLEYMILPDELTLGGAALGLLCLPLRELSLAEAAIGGAVGFLIVWLPFIFLYRAWRGTPGMGLGDAKLLLLAGVWFGWVGAVFALLVGALQGSLVAVAVYAARGKLEEPEAVQRERLQLREELASLPVAERAQLEASLAEDPLLADPEQGLGRARLAFGPFLVLAMFEYLFFGPWLLAAYLGWLTGG
jgi:leader peptidase (prepilin peptidase) / N-methyltransferase